MAALGAALGALIGVVMLLLIQRVPCWLRGHRLTDGGWCSRCFAVVSRQELTTMGVAMGRLAERRAARRYWHRSAPWRSCNRMHRRGLCVRCLWRDVAGTNRRAKATEIARVRAVAATLPRRGRRKP